MKLTLWLPLVLVTAAFALLLARPSPSSEAVHLELDAGLEVPEDAGIDSWLDGGVDPYLEGGPEPLPLPDEGPIPVPPADVYF